MTEDRERELLEIIDELKEELREATDYIRDLESAIEDAWRKVQ
jgi:hypothetical protein